MAVLGSLSWTRMKRHRQLPRLARFSGTFALGGGGWREIALKRVVSFLFTLPERCNQGLRASGVFHELACDAVGRAVGHEIDGAGTSDCSVSAPCKPE